MNYTMNIIDQIRESIEIKNNFFSPNLSDDKILSLKETSHAFLNASSYNELEDHAREMIQTILNIHDKATRLSPTIESMRLYEIYKEYDYEKQRLHFPHLVNVYLLGLYIYHNFSRVKRLIDNRIRMTRNKITLPGLPYSFEYSGNNVEGEFQYRWRLASLCHDIAYPIELCYGNKEKLNNYFLKLRAAISTKISSLEDIYQFRDNNLLTELDTSIPSILLRLYIDYQGKKPSSGMIYHDHGIFSALLFLRLMHEQFSNYTQLLTERDDGSLIITHPILLHGPIVYIAKAIAMHNLDNDENALNYSTLKIKKVYNLHTNSLTWLLKISDELQEWYKPEKNIIKMSDTNLIIDFTNNSILVENYPEKKGNNLKNKFKKFYHPLDIIKFNK